MSAGKFFSIEQPIAYEGPASRNPLAFKWYDPDKVVLGKRMALSPLILILAGFLLVVVLVIVLFAVLK